MHKFSKSIFLILIIPILTNISNVYSQENKTDEYAKEYKQEPSGNWTNRIFTGGNLGLQFGTATFIDVSPMIGYRLTNKLAAGVGITYQYIHYSDQGYKISSNTYGGRIFARYYFVENIFAHIEYESLFLEPIYIGYSGYYKTNRVNVESYLVGGGYRQPIGGRTSLNMLILWNLNETPLSPYQNPLFRIGVGIGL